MPAASRQASNTASDEISSVGRDWAGPQGLAHFFVRRAEIRVTPALRHLGEGRHPLVTIDDVSGCAPDTAEIASELAPFPDDRQSHYPGVRRIIRSSDMPADAYVRDMMQLVAPFIAGAFDAMRFDLLSASFSIVSRAPHELDPVQRAPHFDSTDPDHLAIIHYLRVPASSATAFFRQRATGIERVDDANLDRFVAQARRDAALHPGYGYVQGGGPTYEEIARVEAVSDRLVFYQGSLLHSGIISPADPLDPDPRRGRLTANFFIKLDRET